ncbi:U3 small nucleolar RNA-associated protein MPP10 [Nymphon striatum]|nr:U3 small nucleolar RNA-associated protein MPP10 [Nymphon striatum]
MAVHMCTNLNTVDNSFQLLLKSPEHFISAQENSLKKFKTQTKEIYDCTKDWEKKENNLDNDESLPELIIKDFDDEQLWQQLELTHQCAQATFLKNISKVVVRIGTSLLHRPKIDKSNCQSIAEEAEFVDSKDNETPPAKKAKVSVKCAKNKPKRTTVVDDQFFNIGDMEKYLDQEDRKEMNEHGEEDDEDIDFSRDPDELIDKNDQVGKQDGRHSHVTFIATVCLRAKELGRYGFGRVSGRLVKYKDFFDSLDGEEEDDENVSVNMDDESAEDFNLGDDEEGEEDFNSEDNEEIGNIDVNEEYNTEDYDPQTEKAGEESAQLSNYEKRQENVKKKITEMEESNLAEKPWQLQGEIGALTRPENSLLQEDLQFSHTTRQAPAITEETTQSLESIIIQRIKDKMFDDVTRKEKPKEEVFEYKKRIVLDQEKSKEGLAEIYEKEYLKQKNKDTEGEKEIPEHVEIDRMMKSLFSKLDALSNFHYTPQPPAPEIKIVSNLPAITVEEVAPSSVSDGALLAPEEVLAKTSGELMSKQERTKEDKKHDRRKIKAKARHRKKEKDKRERIIEKLNPGMGNKYSKEEAMKTLEKMGANTTIIKDDESVKTKLTSKAFFAKLGERSSAKTKLKKNGNVKAK